MTALQRMRWRDLWWLRGQVFATALVIACGIASFVATYGTWQALAQTQADYYRQYRFAEIFAPVKRAPLTLLTKLEQMPGVAQVALRVNAEILLDDASRDVLTSARLVSLPAQQPALNGLYLRSGRWPEAKRRLLRARVQREGRVRASGIAMNDAVVKGAGGTAAVHLQMAALGQDLGHLVADGVIAATAAGSTAYSLSAGGPVVAPDVEAMVVTPVAAHSLGSRSLVLAADAELSLRVLGSFDRPMLLLDGQESEALAVGDEVRIRLDRAAVRMVRNPDRPFAKALQGKLGWQGSARRSL